MLLPSYGEICMCMCVHVFFLCVCVIEGNSTYGYMMMEFASILHTVCLNVLTQMREEEDPRACSYVKLKYVICTVIALSGNLPHMESKNRVVTINKPCTCCASQLFSSIPA